MADSIPMIDSILRPREKAKWEKLDGDEEEVQLHRKFWVQCEYNELFNVEEEAAEDDERAAKVIDAVEIAKRVAEVIEGIAGVVEGAAEDDDAVGPECHLLDLGISDPGRWKIWVRKEFIRMYKRCNDHLETNHHESQSPSLIVTGQPGIGKSYWLIYVLCRRLAYKKPIMWYRGQRMYLFVEDGVYMAPIDHPSTAFRTRVWTLVDADQSECVPESLAVPDTKHMIIFASSPKQERWEGMTKTTNYSVAIMNPWTRAEISEAAAIHGFAASTSAIDDLYTRFGPTPRICLDYLISPGRLNGHIDRFRSALSGLSLRSLQDMVNGASVLNMDEVSHTIILMKRRGSDLSRDLKTLEPITPFVEMALRDHFKKELRADRLRLYRSLANVEVSRRLAGVVYESLVQDTLRELNTIELHLVTMTKRSRSTQAKNYLRWHTNHGDGADPSSATLSIKIRRIANNAFSSKPDLIQDKVYFTPNDQNQAAVDSFIMDNNRLFIFQFTIYPDLDIKKGILALFPLQSLPPRENCYFIFVIPPQVSKLCCPQPQDSGTKEEFLERVQLCSVVVNPQP